MKRLFSVLALLALTVTASSGCQGLGGWCNRGDNCQPVYQECAPACEPSCGDVYSGAPFGSAVPPNMEAIPQTMPPTT